MDNRINEIRKKIRALRVSMLQAEAIMHEQINRDEECSEIAGERLMISWNCLWAFRLKAVSEIDSSTMSLQTSTRARK